jgi:hypothetical protein
LAGGLARRRLRTSITVWAFGFLLAVAMLACTAAPSHAIEGSSAAGPIGGTDMRVALIPPPGLYGGVVFVGSSLDNFVDGAGAPVPGLGDARVTGKIGGAFLVYVPNFQLFGGSLAFLGTGSVGEKCGHLFAGTGTQCRFGAGDPYVEAVWGRQFGHFRPSKYPGAFPIFEGLAVTFGMGVVLPLGQYNAAEAQGFASSNGNHVWDFSPSIAITYTTPPLLAEGTEFSAKFYRNNYLINPATQYQTGTLLDVDFAVTEHIGRFQVGGTGFYLTQTGTDKLFGVPIAPDGRKIELLYAGGIVAYDMPEYGASLKVKALTTAIVHNSGSARAIVIGFAKKLD